MLLSWWLSAVQSLLSIPDIVPSSLQLEDQMEKRLRESSAEQTLLLLPATHADRKSDQMHIRRKKKKKRLFKPSLALCLHWETYKRCTAT